VPGVTGAPAVTGPAPRVAFQGELGAYSEEAVRARWGAAARPLPARTCDAVAAAVAAGDAAYGVLPVENTIAGSVTASADALAAAPGLAVVGEVVLAIHHCLVAPPGATLASVASAESHPVALAQCGRFLARHPHVEPRPAYDTAGAAAAVAAAGDVRRAAIAGRAAAGRFGLVVLAADVEDRPDNQTRFLVVAPAARAAADAPRAGVPARTALLAAPPNVPGALVGLLAPFAAAGLNVGTVESRPAGAPWAYRFFVEVEHAAGDPRLAAALAAARSAAGGELRVLGTFARAGAEAGPPAAPPEPGGPARPVRRAAAPAGVPA
jgi:prephenate dehydratase